MMFCTHCGKPLEDGSHFCIYCGAIVTQEMVRPVQQPKKKKLSPLSIVAICAAAMLVVIGILAVVLLGPGSSEGPASLSEDPVDVEEDEDSDQVGQPPAEVEPVFRPQLLSFPAAPELAAPAVTAYEVAPDFSNVENWDQFSYMNEDAKALLEKNQFVVTEQWFSEYFKLYETNRYSQIPNFVTVDSMMHTYHLYFSLLLSNTEKNHLAGMLEGLSKALLEASTAQYQALAGSEWEEAALRNVAFFAVAARLQDDTVVIPDQALSLAEQELEAIYEAAGIGDSALAKDLVDYTQYIPRGNYAGDPVMERYFRAMMWYGQINFAQKEEVLNRSALLMTLAIRSAGPETWSELYTVTSFFSGGSDDLGYYEYLPAVEASYGGVPKTEALIGNETAYETFTATVRQMDPPAINSVPVWQSQTGSSEDMAQKNKGFRFMGQRFTIDAAIMQQLVYRSVTENAASDQRLLPDFLDVPAALGSDLALELVKETGAAEYGGYTENLMALRQTIGAAPDYSWTSSLYSSWLYTLMPVLEVKGTGYPSFMTTAEWQKKNLETFAGSYTELKHDTVLYAKQVMAELGGGPQEIIDDRGYVEPEAEVYRRFALLAEQTASGLDSYGLISDADLENLSRLAELARQLQTISEKELRSETLTDEEYELIRTYGGTLEHFWYEAVKDKVPEGGLATPGELPASLVTDVATDPNGTVLQMGSGKPSEIKVIVPVDGKLRIASGVVYTFYQFEQPMDQRLTDKEWRQLIGEWQLDEGGYTPYEERPKGVWWAQSYRYRWEE